jgi:amidase
MDSNTDYERYDGLGLAGLVKDGSVSADELLEAAIERVEQRNPTIKTVVDRMYDQYAKHSRSLIVAN